MNTEEQIAKFREFFERYHYAELLENLRKGHDFLIISFIELSAFDPELSEILLLRPIEVLAAAELAIKEFDLPRKIVHFYVRISNPPESSRILIRDVRSKHIGRMLWTEGVIRQKSDVRPQV